MQIWNIFQDEYLPSTGADGVERWGRYELFRTSTVSAGDGVTDLTVEFRDGDEQREETSQGNGPVDAFINNLNASGHSVTLFDYVEHAMSEGGDAVAAAYVDLEVDGQRLWGVGIDPDTSRATLKAIVSAVNRSVRNAVAQPETVGAAV